MQGSSAAFPLPVIPGEAICGNFDDVSIVLYSRESIPGFLFVTNYRIVWSPLDPEMISSVEIPLLTVFRVEKIGGKTTKAATTYLVEIHCKDIRVLRLSFLPDKSDRRRSFDLMRSLCFSDHIDGVFAFSNLEESSGAGISAAVDGWNLLDMRKEYSRQGAFSPSNKLADKSEAAWRMCTVNADFKFSDSYPPCFVVPQDISNEQLTEVSAFRSKGRIPVLSWFNCRNRASITRSSQPLTGILRASSAADQQLLEAIYRAGAPSAGTKMLIMDLRPRANAVGNQVKGAGSENMADYGWCELRFLNIENIHVMRESFRKLMELCLATGGHDMRWLTNLDSTQWLEHSHIILYGARMVAEAVERDGRSVLAHCSDGWDRTSQVVSLVLLMLDAYYRTFEGFCILLEKEWLAFGHRFATRTSHGGKNFFHEQGCPIFLQFIDAARSLLEQFPCHFEFKDSFLMEVADAAYSCRFGTFLVDSIAERQSMNLSNRTPSAWSYLLSADIRQMHANPMYFRPRHMQTADTVILPDVSQARQTLWDRYFLRYCRRMPFSEFDLGGYDALDRMTASFKSLRAKIASLDDANVSMSQSNLTTVQTFQRELQDLQRQLAAVQMERDELEQKLEPSVSSPRSLDSK